jgi:hypothetical protein
MSNGVARCDFQSVVGAARAVRGEPQSVFSQVNPLKAERSKGVANSDDRRQGDEGDRKQNLSHDQFADKIDLQDEQNCKRLQQGPANLSLLRHFEKNSLSLLDHFIHDPEPLNPFEPVLLYS